MNKISINKGVPPPIGAGTPGRSIYPFGEMEVGDSFAVPLSGEKSKGGNDKVTDRISSAVSAFKKRADRGLKFSVHTDRSEGVVRCWRMA